MYENNIYVKNHTKLKTYSGDIGVKLDKFDNDHKLKYDALARAQYKYWVLCKNVGCENAKSQLSLNEKYILGL